MPTLDQIDLNALGIFDAVVEAGSFTAAAHRLNVAKAKISVQIARLEQQLGTALFTRTTRRLSLTDAGRQLHEQCQPALLGLQDAILQVGAANKALTGVLRIATSVMHASQSLAPSVARFAALHPDLRIDLRSNDRISDLVTDGIDLSFRMGWLRDSSQRAIKLSEFDQILLAAPAYLKKHGHPQLPQDLRNHAWIALNLLPTPLTWQFSHIDGEMQTVHMRSRLQVDAPSSLLALLQQGAGISVMDSMSAKSEMQSGKLQHLLPEWRLPSGGIYAVLPPGRHVPHKVRAFIDFYRAQLQDYAAN
ncbi:LysR family transcriptional regulator [Undibacterium macrobrachii]|jgi:DNA-binding transcriptional LysR family regulator|uniref:LysR family transcriptional regulator n=1 Tax=Undibacterium macrobrachii TaxID=1119058 RepID=A0ABQ2XGR9_9BURK|nr:LysR family transcriptional regulator [Undibacterium macrobrachii]GGX16139.1 LysR family transcriptional regulator [Undibacterium macrobrachii]